MIPYLFLVIKLDLVLVTKLIIHATEIKLLLDKTHRLICDSLQ
ncbi:MAG: hypothetical protein ACD_46C00221G0021 [uncultured bacterium]|nr:MAG: hypothetical protein ACD_46C00221G0021 [uncultured bacterium]